MPWKREKPTAVLQRTQAEIDIATTGAASKLRFSVENIIARVITMGVQMLDGHIAYIARQIHPTTAEAEYLYSHHGALFDMPPKEPEAAKGAVTFTGVNGVTVPAGTLLRRADNMEYTLDADALISGGTATGNVTAMEAGASGNAVVGVALTLPTPIAAVQSTVTVSGDGLVGGVDVEPEDDYRERILERWRRPPHGGAAHDYIAWAKEVPGITRAWPYPNQQGPGTVTVIVVMDNKEGSIIPSPSEVAVVQEHIEAQRPVTGDVFVVAPTPIEVDFEINISPNSLVVQTAIQNELADLFLRESKPGGTLLISRIREAVSLAAGEFDHTMVSPTANVVRDFGEISVLGTITFGEID